MPVKNVFNIPLCRPFLRELAGWLVSGGGDIARDAVLLPTRRACRALKELLADMSNGAAVLPAITPLGDIDEDGFAFLEYDGEDPSGAAVPPAIPSVERNLILARLIEAKSPDMGGARAYRLALDLARLMDQVQMEELDFSRLSGLVPERYSEYWRQTLEFLNIVAEAYPKILAGRGCMDPVARRALLMRRRAEAWAKSPPPGRVIAAGSTGSLVPVARLLSAVADMERGFVFLPGLDRAMRDEDWARVGQSHPQYGLRNLIAGMGLSREDIPDLPKSENRTIQPGFVKNRETLASYAMLDSGMDGGESLPVFPPDTLRGVSLVTLPNGRAEALALAIVIRDAVPRGKSVRLITPSRGLAKSVSAELRRWNIAADDSHGVQGSETGLGNYMILAAACVADGFPPYSLLALLRHEHTLLGYAKPELEELCGLLEDKVLRGSIEMRGLGRMESRLEELSAAGPDASVGRIKELLHRVSVASEKFGDYFAGEAKWPLADLLKSHLAMLENFCTSAGKGPGFAADLLYSGDMDSQVSSELGNLLSALKGLRGGPLEVDAMSAGDYVGFISDWLFGITARPSASAVYSVSIQNSMEARLLDADLFVMAGLNEGSFPTLAADDPWMSRPMRASFGLPLPERKIGLASHDFAEFFSRPEVVMTRSLKDGGTNAIASRWLLKLEAVCERASLRLDSDYADYVVSVVRGLDAPESVRRVSRPAPRPPLEARPKELWATSVEAWYRDPYIIYADKILRLKKLDDIEKEAGPADFGSIVHKSLEQFETAGFRTYSELVAAMFRNAAPFRGIAMIDFWYARFKSIAKWFVDYRASIEGLVAATRVEVSGGIRISDNFTLRAKADRIDVLKSGGAVVSDYKTGSAPSRREIAEGYAPQLPLEALIFERGGFDGMKGRVEELRFLELGKDKATSYGREADSFDTLLERTLGKLYETVKKFEDGDTPYLSRPNPSKVGASIEEYSEYSHLARVKEWNG
jgi:ATP-dependent helicase/nuclease subunit B